LGRGLPDPQDLLGAAAQRLDDRTERLRLAADRQLRARSVDSTSGRSRARLVETEPRLHAAMARFIDRSHEQVDNFAGRLATHSERHESLLARGYVVVRDAIARVVTTSEAITTGAPLDLEFHDGRVGVTAGSKPRPRTRRYAAHPGQGSLF